nr:YdcF family protein [Marinicella sp. W31]MDC2875659.1 YdcF family protein [Marinicella sp. W31]
MAKQVRKSPETSGDGNGARGHETTRGGLVLRAVLVAGLAVLIAFGGGFIWFSTKILTARPPPLYETDAVVVLTGGARRIDEALVLLAEGAGERLLISGVNPSTTPESIRNLTGGDSQLFDCCVDVGYEALDTYGNAVETRKWIEEHNYRRVLVVTSAYHMPRGLFELRHIDPDTVFVAYPVPLGRVTASGITIFAM